MKEIPEHGQRGDTKEREKRDFREISSDKEGVRRHRVAWKEAAKPARLTQGQRDATTETTVVLTQASCALKHTRQESATWTKIHVNTIKLGGIQS